MADNLSNLQESLSSEYRSIEGQFVQKFGRKHMRERISLELKLVEEDQKDEPTDNFPSKVHYVLEQTFYSGSSDDRRAIQTSKCELGRMRYQPFENMPERQVRESKGVPEMIFGELFVYLHEAAGNMELSEIKLITPADFWEEMRKRCKAASSLPNTIWPGAGGKPHSMLTIPKDSNERKLLMQTLDVARQEMSDYLVEIKPQ